eukprot:g2515.t1
METRHCNTFSCTDCKVTPFTAWSPCSQSCGTSGVSTRTRNVVISPQAGGKECPALSEQKWCGPDPCPVHCGVTQWLAWSTCSHKCGGGTQKRRRYVSQEAKHGGRACPAQSEHRICNQQPCPIDCTVGDFGLWTRCTKTCGGGLQTRTRQVIHPAQHGGVCLRLNQTQSCANQPCPVPCQPSSFGAWSKCTAACGYHGLQSRSRSVVSPARFNGRDCQPLVQTQKCNQRDCGPPVRCSHISCRAERKADDSRNVRVLHSVNYTHRELEGDMHFCKLNKATDACECKCFTADWALQHGVKGAIATSNALIVAAHGGINTWNSTHHGRFYETNTTAQTEKGVGWTSSRATGAYEWSIHHVQHDRGGMDRRRQGIGIGSGIEHDIAPAVAAADAATVL